ncbi:hypothetical protein H5410_058423 [Solanum commersonii]|uniref:Uncharacterized protein n=1 Tax=Solanum commersonii TaxID=4109 RepID=A0A9J5WR17_SOLCO|nr:hypothetical protein H5410_058423 [Solanum commersonii]
MKLAVISTAENSGPHLRRLELSETDENPPRKPQTSIGSSCPTKVRIDNPEDSIGNATFYELAERSLDEPVNDGMKEHISKRRDQLGSEPISSNGDTRKEFIQSRKGINSCALEIP